MNEKSACGLVALARLDQPPAFSVQSKKRDCGGDLRARLPGTYRRVMAAGLALVALGQTAQAADELPQPAPAPSDDALAFGPELALKQAA
jgi:hypothetical protein